MAIGKRFKKASEDLNPETYYPLAQAVQLVKSKATAKFDETIELSLNLNIDPKKSEQNLRGTVMLPSGTGKTLRVAVFAKGARADEAKAAGADVVGAEDLAEKVQAGQIEFDRAIATPDMMGIVGRLGKVLGPRGLMPNPKLGTVTFDVSKAVREAKAGKVEFRVDKAGNIHTPVGKKSFTPENIQANAMAVIEAIVRAKPSAAKGAYLRTVTLSTTMSPGVTIDAAALANLFKKAV